MPIVDFSLEGKVAVVTGASRGIGEYIARAFAEYGAKVVLSSRKQEGLDAVADSIRKVGGEAVGIACHGGKVEEMDALFAGTLDKYGRLDILVNNAATNPFFGNAIDIPESAWDKTVEVNLRGYFMMMQKAAHIMRDQGEGGNIINVASVGGLRPGPGEATYAMTKAGVINITKGFAKELGPHNIRVNALAPGVVETYFAATLIDSDEKKENVVARTPLGKWGQPSDIAGAAVYLASDASSYVTGSVIVLDGGSSA